MQVFFVYRINPREKDNNVDKYKAVPQLVVVLSFVAKYWIFNLLAELICSQLR